MIPLILYDLYVTFLHVFHMLFFHWSTMNIFTTGLTVGSIWIGLNDAASEGTLVWSASGRQVVPGTDYTNNLLGGGSSYSDCVRIDRFTGLWGVANCNYPTVRGNSLCEIDPL